MLAKLRPSIRRPRPATVIAFVALVFAMAGGAVAKDRIDKDEVTTVTTSGGPVQTSDPFQGSGLFGQDAIPLDSPTFTQKAGEVVLVSATADVSGVDQGTATCDLHITITGTDGEVSEELGPVSGELGLEMRRLARRGDAGDLGDSQALPAPAADREITLVALASEEEFEKGACGNHTYTVSVRVSVTTLRN